MLKHPNLLHLYDIQETNSNFYVVTQFCDGGDMEDYVLARSGLEESEAVFYLKQVMSGFMELHSLKIMHRDFKLANIFLHQGSVVIGDFGFAKAGAEIAKTRLGTPYNMAPEILFSTGKTPYTNLTDIWSIGVVFFQMLYGNLPFPAYQLEELKRKVKKFSGKHLIFPTIPKTSEESKDLLRRMLELDPAKRITWKEFFNHSIFNRYNQESFVPEYSVSSLSLSMYESRNVNEDKANPFERASKVEKNFEIARSKAMLVSDRFNLPQPLDLNISAGRLTFGRPSPNRTTNQSMTSQVGDSYDTNSNMFAHQRNKHLLVFQAAKRARELAKLTTFDLKHGYLMTLTLALTKKGLMMLENNCRMIDNKINLYKLSMFENWCTSSQGAETRK